MESESVMVSQRRQWKCDAGQKKKKTGNKCEEKARKLRLGIKHPQNEWVRSEVNKCEKIKREFIYFKKKKSFELNGQVIGL